MQTAKLIDQKFHEWLDNLSKTESIDKSIIAFNFGLFESGDGFTMYLNGSKIFDKDDDDWAANMDFEPKQKYFSFGKEFLKNKDWEDILKYSENLVETYIASEAFKTSIFAQAKGIAVGFDGGDLTILKS